MLPSVRMVNPHCSPVDIETNLRAVRERIEAAAGRAGRDPTQITLLAVSKRVEPARIDAAIAAGVRLLGESRVQEAEEKIPLISGAATWHFIGPLQSNKARLAAMLFDAVHSVRRASLVPRLGDGASQAGREVEIYVQLDPAAGDPSEASVAAAAELCGRVMAAHSLRLVGLMTMAPYDPHREAARPYFRNLRAVRDRVTAADPSLPELGLSMGMSGDFEVAIEEGATIVRVGSAIFGPRPV